MKTFLSFFLSFFLSLVLSAQCTNPNNPVCPKCTNPDIQCAECGPCTVFLYCGDTNEGTECDIYVSCTQDVFVSLTDSSLTYGFGSAYLGPNTWQCWAGNAWEYDAFGRPTNFAGWATIRIYQWVNGVYTNTYSCPYYFNCK